jgi:hypothetical protein
VTERAKPVQVADAAGDARAREGAGLGRLWWRRTASVLWAPRAVFEALRETDEDDQAARQEPILAIVLLAGMSAVLMMGSSVAPDQSVDGLVVAVLTFLAGGVYGAAAYLLLGVAISLGLRGAGTGGPGSARLGRHVVAFASVPIALAFPLLGLGVALAYGAEYARGEAPDSSTWVVLGLSLPFVAWSAGLAVLGLQVTFRLAWIAVATTVALASAVVAAFVVLPFAF